MVAISSPQIWCSSTHAPPLRTVRHLVPPLPRILQFWSDFVWSLIAQRPRYHTTTKLSITQLRIVQFLSNLLQNVII